MGSLSNGLAGRVAVVTGASRGIGKGIACALAEHGATVYVTGRTVNPGQHALPGTVNQTVEEVNARGGRGVAVPLDLADDAQIAALFEQVRRDEGRLDILVNNAMAIPDAMTRRDAFGKSRSTSGRSGTPGCARPISLPGMQHRSWSRKDRG